MAGLLLPPAQKKKKSATFVEASSFSFDSHFFKHLVGAISYCTQKNVDGLGYHDESEEWCVGDVAAGSRFDQDKLANTLECSTGC